MKKLFALAICLSFLLPTSTFAYTKKANYQDFTAWYLQKTGKKSVPYVSASIIDAYDYQPLYYHGEGRVMPIASLTKVFTAGAFRIYPTDYSKLMTFSQADNETDLRVFVGPTDPFSLLRLEPDEYVTIEQAFGTMLIGSANNAANALPKLVAYDKNEFVAVMNAVAKDWGLKNTVLVEPTGLSLENVSNAADMSLGICHALEDAMTRKYAGYSYLKFQTSTGRDKNILHTVHSLRDDLKYEKFYGAKTGFLYETGYHVTAGMYTPMKKEFCATVLSTATRQESEDVLDWMRLWLDEMYY